MTHRSSYSSLESWNYQYDATNRLTSATDASSVSKNYAYDATSQITGVTGGETGAYSYDTNGNRTMSGYTVGTDNRQLTGAGFSYVFDNEGNITRKTNTTTGETLDLEYDHRNRLTQATRKNSSGTVIGNVAFNYDALDRRVRITTDADGAGSNSATSLWTVYDGDNAYADFGNNASVQTTYLHGAGVDNLLGRTNVATGSTQWYINDHLGSVRRIVDSWGTTLYTANFDVFGNRITTTGSAGDRWGWTGREFDAVSGLQYNRARYYDPQSGRWLSKDPIGFAAGDSNLYRYVGNGSPNHTDPSGLFTWMSALVGMAVGTVISTVAYTATSVAHGEFSLTGAGIAAASGAVGGFVAGATLSPAAGGAAGALVGSTLNQISQKGITGLDRKSAAIIAADTAIGAATGGVAGKVLGPNIPKTAGGKIKGISIGAGLGGVAGGVSGGVGAAVNRTSIAEGVKGGATRGIVAGAAGTGTWYGTGSMARPNCPPSSAPKTGKPQNEPVPAKAEHRKPTTTEMDPHEQPQPVRDPEAEVMPPAPKDPEAEVMPMDPESNLPNPQPSPQSPSAGVPKETVAHKSAPGRKVYRGMMEDPNGRPEIGASARKLGVRPEEIPTTEGQVGPNTGGMSVAPDKPGNLPAHRRPPSFGGTGKDPVWEFDLNDLYGGVKFRQDSSKHGLFEPESFMSFVDFQKALAGLAEHWKKL